MSPERNATSEDLTATEARQGVRSRRVRRVLIFSIVLAAGALAVVLALIP